MITSHICGKNHQNLRVTKISLCLAKCIQLLFKNESWTYTYHHHRNLLSDWGRDLQYFSTFKTTKPPSEAGKALPKCTASPWFCMGCASICSRGRPWHCRAPAAEQGVPALCRASEAQPPLSGAQSQRCTPGKKPQAQKQPDMGGRTAQPRVTRVLNHTPVRNHNSSLEWRSVQQDEPGILHAATWGSALHCPFPVLHPAICHPPVQSWSCMIDTKGKILILMFKITMLKIDRFLQWILLFCLLFLRNTSIARNWVGKKHC